MESTKVASPARSDNVKPSAAPSKSKDNSTAKESSNGVAAAVARALTRGVAVYFSRPVRLFRPSKVSGWTTLRGAAQRDGMSLNPAYMLHLIRSHGIIVIPRHFFPPLIVNTLLGTVLWGSYSYSSSHLERLIPSHPVVVAAMSGAIAGGLQSVAAAPAENVRMILEGATDHPVKALLKQPGVPAVQHQAHSGWTNAWKQVFNGTDPIVRAETREEVREVTQWVKEIRGMAGRGWDGWTWGCMKDMAGFALFFSIFEGSRKVANYAAFESVKFLDHLPRTNPPSAKTRTSTARAVHAVTLVSGGVIAGLGYEMVCRPFDNARRVVHLADTHRRGEHIRLAASNASVQFDTAVEPRLAVISRDIFQKIESDGLRYFFRDPQAIPLHVQAQASATSGSNRALYAFLRTMARLGPWGIGFLVWEGIGGGLPQV